AIQRGELLAAVGREAAVRRARRWQWREGACKTTDIASRPCGLEEKAAMSEEIPFPELIRRVRMGDDQAAAELVRRYEPAIRRVARVRLTDPRLQRLFDSMDVCQSVFGSFFIRTALGEYELETPEQLLHLLAAMTRKKVVDQSRRARAARR